MSYKESSSLPCCGSKHKHKETAHLYNIFEFVVETEMTYQEL